MSKTSIDEQIESEVGELQQMVKLSGNEIINMKKNTNVYEI